MEQTEYIPKTLIATTDGIKLSYWQDGKSVMLSAIGNFSKAETITSSNKLELGTIPAGHRPADTLFYPLGFLYANANNLTLMVENNGKVSICSTSGDINITSGKYFNFAVGFIL